MIWYNILNNIFYSLSPWNLACNWVLEIDILLPNRKQVFSPPTLPKTDSKTWTDGQNPPEQDILVTQNMADWPVHFCKQQDTKFGPMNFFWDNFEIGDDSDYSTSH